MDKQRQRKLPKIYLGVFCVTLMSNVSAQETISGFDYYGPLVEWKDASGLDAAPIHGGLLPNGKLYFMNNYKFYKYPEQDLTDPNFVPEYMFLMDSTPAFQPTPSSFLIAPQMSPLAPSPTLSTDGKSISIKTLTCSGHAPMDDGSIFFASGAATKVDLELYNQGKLTESLTVDGIEDAVTYNPFTDSWVKNPDMIGIAPETGKPIRWYATVTRLANSKMLITGGYEQVVPAYQYNNSIELFDVDNNDWTLISDQTQTPTGIENPDYTHVFQYPFSYTDMAPDYSGDDINVVLMMGGSGEPLYFFHGDQGSFWYETNQYRPGAVEFVDAKAPTKVFPNHGSTTVMLPIRLPEDSWNYKNGSMLVAGGAHHSPMEGNIDIYDTGTNTWRPSIPMGGLRHHGSSILLPDGRVLILGGHDDMSEVKITGYAQYVDPKNDFALTRGVDQMPEVRGYHAVAVLLPDGRVLLGGGNPGGEAGSELTDFRYYYPDYMFKPRPQILYAEDELSFNEFEVIFVPHKTIVDEVNLVGLASMTHSFDMNQRHIQLRTLNPEITLKFQNNSLDIVEPTECIGQENLCLDAHIVQGPEKPELAPPGHYTLFILDEHRSPSVGKIIKLN